MIVRLKGYVRSSLPIPLNSPLPSQTEEKRDKSIAFARTTNQNSEISTCIMQIVLHTW